MKDKPLIAFCIVLFSATFLCFAYDTFYRVEPKIGWKCVEGDLMDGCKIKWYVVN